MANYTVNAYNNNGSGGSVNMRSGAGTSYGIVVQVPHGATVTGTKSGTWSQMTYGSKSGYMMSVYLDDPGSGGSTSVVGNHTDVNGWIEVSKTDVNARETAPGGAILYRVSSPTQSQVYDKTTKVTEGVTYAWYKIKPGTTYGWIRGDMCKNITSSGGSTGGTASFTAGNLCELTATSKVRTAARTDASTLGAVPKGAQFIIAGTEEGWTVSSSTLWVKIYWGNSSGTVSQRYIHSSLVKDLGYGISYNAKNRFMAIARSHKTSKPSGAVIGLTEKWCQNYMYFLGCATGRKPSGLPYGKGLCKDALAMLGTQYAINGNNVPQAGDWVYYRFSGNTTTVDHVGLVDSVDTSAKTFTTIEGNLKSGSASGTDGSVGTAKVSYVDGTGATGRTAFCFVRPSYA